MLDLYLVRHAHTAPNADGRYPHAHEDAPLSEQGRAQARALQGRLPGATAFVSPARRAFETAVLAGVPDARPVPALHEAHFGVMHGHTWAALETQHGDAPRTWIDALADPHADHGPPGGDTGRAFHARVQGWLNDLPDAGPVVAFTHAGVVLAALRLTVGLRAAEVHAARVTHLRRHEGAWWLVTLNA
ncbi:histidine phosphatase family protein [Deinococcus maricopensis]|uniref:Phosphoglycerate mutase n=1 Tax=Deinococcus maricopensis (strain DSM 21211 / LMG 22137 / NRRL B-23946 / LB-34) TaxID=709986 RepID=E8U9K3_DEIML|nr:histidine phosphatase family protein [Deinococcus maricopensis]ADV67742.1 Phosphoglycerate mutase [Deinococcus maricopensis DSM 21211]